MKSWRDYKLLVQIATVVFVLSLTLPALAVTGTTTGAENPAGFVPGEIIVKFKDAAPGVQAQTRLQTTHQALGLAVKRTLPGNVVLLQTTASVPGAVQVLNQDPQVAYAQPNFLFKTMTTATSEITDDPLLPQQWGVIDRNYGVQLAGAWRYTRGSGEVIIAVIDTGVDYRHEDLKNNIWVNTAEIAGDGKDNDSNGYIDDRYGWDFIGADFENPQPDNDPADVGGHGTHVAGIIAAKADNGKGITGVAPQAKIMALKVFDDNGDATSVVIAEAIHYAAENGAQVVNMSLGTDPVIGGNPTLAFCRLTYATIQSYPEVLFVAAAGNVTNDNDRYPVFPAGYAMDNLVDTNGDQTGDTVFRALPNISSVAALNQQGNLAGFSNYGVKSVDLAAPGELIISTIPNSQYGHKQGTSMAAPFVAGGAGLVLSRQNNLSPGEVIAILNQEVTKLAMLTGKVAAAGTLNLEKALDHIATPEVRVTSPADGATGVAIDQDISVKFSENIFSGTQFEAIVIKDEHTVVANVYKSVDQDTLTLDPVGNLSYSTKYWVTIPARSIKNDVGNTLTGDYHFSFTTQNPPDFIAPEVKTTTPAGDATGVAIDQDIIVNFSEKVVKGTHFGDIIIKAGEMPVGNIHKSIDQHRLILNPVGKLLDDTKYTITIPSKAIRDRAENPLTGDYTFSFTTKDLTAPVVRVTDPLDGATGVAVDQNISVNFSESVLKAVYFEDIVVKTGNTVIASVYKSIDQHILTLDPGGSLLYSTEYTITILAGSIKDVAGNLLTSGTSFSFTTQVLPDSTAPVVRITDPLEGATGVAVDQNISVNFSEKIAKGPYFDDIAVKTGDTVVASADNIDQNTLTLNPDGSLLPGTEYTITIPAGSIKDVAGNFLTGNAGFSFTTQAVASGGGGAAGGAAGGGSGGGGGGGGGGVSSVTSTGTVDTVSASNVAIAIRKAKKTGKVALKIPSGEAELAITANSLQNIKATGKPLAVALKHVEILIPPAVLKQLVEIRNVKQVQFEAESLSAKEAVRLADKATNTHLFSLADRVFELSITVLKKGGKKEYLTKPDGKLQVTLPVRDQKAVKLGEQGKLTVCRFAKTAKAWQDKGGKYNAATKTITFSTDRFSKFAIMEVKTVKTPGIEVREKTASFTDITGHWAQDDIKTMFELGLVKGVSATEFAPDQTVTRAEFATLLVRATGVATAGVTGKFTDVPPGVWYFEVVNAAAAAGLVGGYGDNIFKPDELITREQMASMVTRALVYKGQGVTLTSPEVNNRLAPFKDRHEIAGWARQSVAEAVASNIVSGRAATVFAPQANATRGEGAVMILRMYNQF